MLLNGHSNYELNLITEDLKNVYSLCILGRIQIYFQHKIESKFIDNILGEQKVPNIIKYALRRSQNGLSFEDIDSVSIKMFDKLLDIIKTENQTTINCFYTLYI
jgi:hypothetical protein